MLPLKTMLNLHGAGEPWPSVLLLILITIVRFCIWPKCLILDLVHSGMGMNTMMHLQEGYYSNNKYICLLLGLTMVLKRINFKGSYLDF